MPPRKLTRHQLRNSLREKQKFLSENEHMLTTSVEGYRTLFQSINDSNELVDNIVATREGIIDATNLYRCTEMSRKRADNFTSESTISGSEFISELKLKYTADEMLSQSSIDFCRIGESVSQYFYSAPSLLFMNGPIGATPRKRARVLSQRTKRADQVEVGLKNRNEDADKEKKEFVSRTSRLAKWLAKYHHRYGKWPQWVETVTYPDSFTKSAEEIFYVAFMIRDGILRLFSEEREVGPNKVKKVLCVEKIEDVSASAAASQSDSQAAAKRKKMDASSHQAILPFKYSQWEVARDWCKANDTGRK